MLLFIQSSEKLATKTYKENEWRIGCFEPKWIQNRNKKKIVLPKQSTQRLATKSRFVILFKLNLFFIIISMGLLIRL